MKPTNFITLDTETCGLHSPIVLLQYAYGMEGEVQLYCPWTEKIQTTIQLFEEIINNPDGILGFNLTFDLFHVAQMYTTLLLMKDKSKYLDSCIEEYALNEPAARDGPCIKFAHICDVFLLARKSHYQSLMERKDISIRRVPSVLAVQLARELDKRVPLKDIYFARKSNPSGPRFICYPIKNKLIGDYIEDFVDIKVKFAPSSALKALAGDALGVKSEDILRFSDISPKLFPNDLGYAPFALAIGTPADWKGAWPEYIRFHIRHWAHNEDARRYAANDVIYTRELYKYFGCPDFDDVDSILAGQVAVSRWKGYNVDIEGLKYLKKQVLSRRYKVVNGDRYKIPTAPNDVKRYILAAMDETEQAGFKGTTAKVQMEELAAALRATCPTCKGNENEKCPDCNGLGTVQHEASRRILEVLDARKVDKEIELYDKVLLAGRLHASLKIIGTLSSRMSGADGLNIQAIKSTKQVKSKFLIPDLEHILCGADFDSYEITLADACYNDSNLHKQLLTCEACRSNMIFDKNIRDYKCTKCESNKGLKIHSILGMEFFPGMSYDQIKNTANTSNDLYTAAKRGVFALLYGAEPHTLKERIGISEEAAIIGYNNFLKRYPGVRKARQKIIDMFQTMRQEGGIGTRVTWKDPAEYISNMLDFRRYFTLENRICKALFDLANKIPQSWRDIKVKVQRRDRVQTPGGAVSSALYAAAFNIQSKVMKAANNHVIQSTGAQITKYVQARIWDVQPAGIHDWIVQPLNVHDSISCPTRFDYVDKVKEVVIEAVEHFRDLVPLIKFDWEIGLKHWADKGGSIDCEQYRQLVNKSEQGKKEKKQIEEHLQTCWRCESERNNT